MQSKLNGVLVGVVFIVMGIGFAGEMFNWWEFNPFFDGWWTLFIIVPSIISLCTGKEKIRALIGLAVGIVLLLGVRGLLDFEILLPAILVVLGIRFIIKALGNQGNTSDYYKKEDSDL